MHFAVLFCIFSLSVLLLLLFFSFAVLLNCPYPDPRVFTFFFSFHSSPHFSGERCDRATALSFVAGHGQMKTFIMWHPTWSGDNGRAEQSELKQLVVCVCCISEIVTSQNVAVFGHVIVVGKPLLAVLVHYGVVHHRWEKDQDYDFTVLYNINL